MNRVDFLVLHCSATPSTQDIGAADIRRWHRANGWADIGYHYVIKRDGTVEKGRPDDRPGAHEPKVNARSIAVCLVGGSPPLKSEAHKKGLGEDNFTASQWASLEKLVKSLKARHPHAEVLGHRDVPGVRKACPSFDSRAWWKRVSAD